VDNGAFNKVSKAGGNATVWNRIRTLRFVGSNNDNKCNIFMSELTNIMGLLLASLLALLGILIIVKTDKDTPNKGTMLFWGFAYISMSAILFKILT
jgi:hypothetical protein